MRLPTIDELKVAYNAGVTESWKKDGLMYWSSSPAGGGKYYFLSVFDGKVLDFILDFNNNVRCRR